ncbi:MAG: phage/plasmid primase, P4 family [Bacteroidales bacterium]
MIDKKQSPSDSAKSSGEDEILQDKNTNFLGLLKSDIQSNLTKMSAIGTELTLPHKEILIELLNQVDTIDFDLLAFPQKKKIKKRMEEIETFISNENESTDGGHEESKQSEELKKLNKELDKMKVNQKHHLILSIENIMEVARKNNWGLCKNLNFIYLFNGAYWSEIDNNEFQSFLGNASEKMGVTKYTARFFQFREQLFKQFLSSSYLPTPLVSNDIVKINLLNGTFEITPNSSKLKKFNRDDFMTYQLPFAYEPKATAPIFQAYLDRVLPDQNLQYILAEFLGFVFMKNGNSSIKIEKTLMLYGGGANGKSVFFQVVNALLGSENVSSYSLQSLTNENGYYRAKIANKLVNYASEISGTLETATFKQMVSGEPLEARLPYGDPFTLTQYAKLIFNANKLPRDVEHTNAYFRRFLIIPFEVTIPEEEQDKELHTKIIKNELSGVFNWVLEGLNRLLEQKNFTYSDVVQKAREDYELKSDSVRVFIDEMEYKKSPTEYVLRKELYREYRNFCNEEGFKAVSNTNFIERLESFGCQIEKKNVGNVVFVTKPFC